MTVKQKISALLGQLNKGVYEKEEVIKLALLSAIAGESIFLLGAPGVAKSLVARRLKFAFKENGAFEYLMNRFSTPDEIFGPVAISKLKNEDKYERVVKNYLPSATVVFLDEIWKAGPSIQNALLTVLNEKKYRNGEQEIDVPMKALISASNELPMKDSGLDALWDRFLIRLEVKDIQDKQAFNEMITKPLDISQDTVKDELKISDEEYKQWSKAIDQIMMPENVLNVIHVIRNYIEQHNQKEENKDNPIYISDRRWKKIARLLRTSAFLNDRKEADLMDCFLIIPCLWNETKQFKAVEQFVKDAVEKHGLSKFFDFKSEKAIVQNLSKEVAESTTCYQLVTKKRLKLFDNEYYRFKITYRRQFRDRWNSEDTRWYYIKADDVKALKIKEEVQLDEFELQIYNNMNHSYEKNFDFLEKIHAYDHFYNRGDGTLIKHDEFTISVIVTSNRTMDEKSNYTFVFETEDYQEKELVTKDPSQEDIRNWDLILDSTLSKANKLIGEIEKFRTDYFKDFQSNLFGNSEFAKNIKTCIEDEIKEIDKVKVEIESIRSKYKNSTTDLKLIGI